MSTCYSRCNQTAILALALVVGLLLGACSLLPVPDPAPTTTTTLAPTTTTRAPSTTTSTTTSPTTIAVGTKNILDALCAQTTSTTVSAALPSSLEEISGLAASRTYADTVWAIEDSGNPAKVYALGLNGTVLATISLSPATNIDWEAIALRPGPNGDQLVVADVGDNPSARASVTFYLFDEPTLANATISPEKIIATYSDGPHNAESVVATNSSILVITKQSGIASIYRLDGTILHPIASLADNPGLVTDANLSADNGLTAIRTYGSIRLARVVNNDVITALASTGCTMPFPEPQGEAITFLPDGSGLVTTSEIAPATLKVIRPSP